MTAWERFVAFCAAFFTPPRSPLEVQAEIVEYENAVYAVVRVGGYYARERLPRQIYKWDEVRQYEYIDKVKERLLLKLKFRPEDAPPPRDMNRKERKAKAAHIKKHGVAPTRIRVR